MQQPSSIIYNPPPTTTSPLQSKLYMYVHSAMMYVTCRILKVCEYIVYYFIFFTIRGEILYVSTAFIKTQLEAHSLSLSASSHCSMLCPKVGISVILLQ